MNLSGFSHEYNATFKLFDVNETAEQQQPSDDEFDAVNTFYHVFQYVCMTLGIPGNILSAIVWLRLHVASKNSSAVYLAALAVNDLFFLMQKLTFIYSIDECASWFCCCSVFLHLSTTTLEPLLVLGFCVERLIAVCCPLQVCCINLHNLHVFLSFFYLLCTCCE